MPSVMKACVSNTGWVVKCSPNQLDVRFKAQVCSHWITGIAGLNLAEGMDIYLLCLLCVVLLAASAMGPSFVQRNRIECVCVCVCVYVCVIACDLET